jgi:SAM-dependent methyltransferase
MSEGVAGASAVVPREMMHDVLRGIAALTDHPLVADLARVVDQHPEADLSPAFSPKQIASKRWLIDALHATLGGEHADLLILGGWYGVLAAMLAADRRFVIGRITSLDLDPGCEAVARTLNGEAARAGRFTAITADMLSIDYPRAGADLVINTSTEHLDHPGDWLARLPRGQAVILQSNDFFAEPTHRSCVPDLSAFKAQMPLSEIAFEGSLPSKRYTRFMLIGRV